MVNLDTPLDRNESGHAAPTLEFILPQYVDSTMMLSAKGCLRKFANEFCYGLRGMGTSIHLHAGGVFASTLEAFRKKFYEEKVLPTTDLAAKIEAAKRVANQVFFREWGDVTAPEKSAKTPGNVWLAFEDYLSTFPPVTDHVQPYFHETLPTFEFSFAIPLDYEGFPLHPKTGMPFIYCGRFDQLGTWHGKPCIQDDKTTSSAGTTWSEQWSLRSQLIGYCWACQASGIPVEIAVIRGIVIQKTSIRCLEAIKYYPKHLIDRWFEQLRRDLWRIVNAYNAGYWDYNLGDKCYDYGSCQFLGICESPDDRFEALTAPFVVNRWDPTARMPVRIDNIVEG